MTVLLCCSTPYAAFLSSLFVSSFARREDAIASRLGAPSIVKNRHRHRLSRGGDGEQQPPPPMGLPRTPVVAAAAAAAALRVRPAVVVVVAGAVVVCDHDFLVVAV